MARKRYSDEDVLKLLLEIEVHLYDGMDVISACRKAGISDKTYYGWRKKFGGMGRPKHHQSLTPQTRQQHGHVWGRLCFPKWLQLLALLGQRLQQTPIPAHGTILLVPNCAAIELHLSHG